MWVNKYIGVVASVGIGIDPSREPYRITLEICRLHLIVVCPQMSFLERESVFVDHVRGEWIAPWGGL